MPETRSESGLFRGRRPAELAFGTSGLRGLVTEITDLEAYVNTLGFLDHVFECEPALPRSIPLGGDLRPSTHSEERSILRAVATACRDRGLEVIHCGRLPTPALTFFGFQRGLASIMVTGSHIPFDRNGIKFNMPRREVLKSDEPAILAAVGRVRAHEYGKAPEASAFDDAGMFRPGYALELPAVSPEARELYEQRYLGFFPDGVLEGLRVAVYQHSAVGRDLLVDVLRRLGASVQPVGRSEEFVAIDTEAIDAARLAELDRVHRQVLEEFGTVDAIVSTDGDSDRPLVLGIDAERRLQFVPGDVLGMLVADALDVDAIAVPVSATDAIDTVFSERIRLARTKIGSPWVVAALEALPGRRRVGWEANGGFLLGTALEQRGRSLAALPTRDAFLPIACVLSQVKLKRQSIVELCAALPQRHGRAGLIDVDEPAGALLTEYLVPPLAGIGQVDFTGAHPVWVDTLGERHAANADEARRLGEIRARLGQHLFPEVGPAGIERVDFVDGIRCYARGGDIAHVRASGNAPQLRMYATSDSPERARDLVNRAISPQGTLFGIFQAARTERFVEAVAKNIAHTEHLLREGTPAQVIGTVSGSSSAQRFWQHALDTMKSDLRAREAISFHEDLPTNQAFGLLLLWQRLRANLRPDEGALIAFVFGEGSRATPFTETDNGQKPAIASFVRAGAERAAGQRQLALQTMVGLALRCFAPVEAHLRRSGFQGVVVKWGDEVQIPARDLSGSDPLFREADVIRFVSMRLIDEGTAKDKDWVGVDFSGRVTTFIPRRPLSEMRALADRGLLQVRGDGLLGGINLGSIAVSRVLLEALLEEFAHEVNDASADRKLRPDLDPQFFTVLMTALIDDEEERAQSYAQTVREVPALAKLERTFPDLLGRLRRVVTQFTALHGRKPKVVAMDFVDQYWGDVGQHKDIRRFYMALNQADADGHIARALAGLKGPRDARGNLISEDSVVAPGIDVERSVLIGCELSGSGTIRDSVLIGTRARDISADGAFDVLSALPKLELARGAGTYKIVSSAPLSVSENERMTTLFLPGGREASMRVHEDLDLRDRQNHYETAVLDNPVSFSEAHELMMSMPVEELEARRARATEVALARISNADD